MMHFLSNRKETPAYVVFSFVLLIVGGLFFIKKYENPSTSNPVVQEEIVEETPATEYTFTAPASMTAEELLDQEAEVEYQDFGTAGKFVKSINGTESNEAYFWAFYVNDAFAEAGVSQTQLETGDTIRFTYEKIEPLQ